MLKGLHVEALRGATKKLSLTFDPTKQIAIVYGENGSGKSSICDSLDFLLRGRVGSVEDRGLGRSIENFWHSTGRSPSDVKVLLETKGGSWEARLVSGKVVVTPIAGFPRLAILRRKQILSWIAARSPSLVSTRSAPLSTFRPLSKQSRIFKDSSIPKRDAKVTPLSESLRTRERSRTTGLSRGSQED